jgi:hypothetical protein
MQFGNGTATAGDIKKPALQPPVLPPGASFTPSPIKRVQFSNGEIIPLNRRQRRQMKIYNSKLRRS